jgi:hypothetical protein
MLTPQYVSVWKHAQLTYQLWSDFKRFCWHKSTSSRDPDMTSSEVWRHILSFLPEEVQKWLTNKVRGHILRLRTDGDGRVVLRLWFYALTIRLPSLVQMSVYLWCLNDNIITVNNVCFVIISDVVFASTTNVKSLLNMLGIFIVYYTAMGTCLCIRVDNQRCISIICRFCFGCKNGDKFIKILLV